ncbi:MAG TPA: AbrB/MazE/SpoVT family DNA-binding domain-containing protein [Dehalococcoidia bacterium]|nr:AbrB/MazE/SpoVT family DNA-binding domain-containing protein [Dehalococcoidia bacterium]
MDTIGNGDCCSPEAGSCCRVEALVSIDERGQMVLPKELREKVGIRPGDKLALTTWERDGRVCCITMTKVEELTDMVKATLGPVMRDIL